MSEFIRRLQERLRTQNQGARHPITQKPSNSKQKLKELANRLHQWRPTTHPVPSQMTALLPKNIKPSMVATSVTYLLMIATVVSISYWGLRIAQILPPPGSSNLGITKGMTLYNNQDASAAYDLFGSKPLMVENIFLRGVVITSRSGNGYLDGYAIFEIDGKPTNAISIGENLGKGLSLQSIGEESAILAYQGQQLEFKLNKASKKPISTNKK